MYTVHCTHYSCIFIIIQQWNNIKKFFSVFLLLLFQLHLLLLLPHFFFLIIGKNWRFHNQLLMMVSFCLLLFGYEVFICGLFDYIWISISIYRISFVYFGYWTFCYDLYPYMEIWMKRNNGMKIFLEFGEQFVKTFTWIQSFH